MKKIAEFKTIVEYTDLKALKYKTKNIKVEFSKDRQKECVLNDNEIIVGMDIGVDVEGNVNNFRFILASVWKHTILLTGRK